MLNNNNNNNNDDNNDDDNDDDNNNADTLSLRLHLQYMCFYTV